MLGGSPEAGVLLNSDFVQLQEDISSDTAI